MTIDISSPSRRKAVRVFRRAKHSSEIIEIKGFSWILRFWYDFNSNEIEHVKNPVLGVRSRNSEIRLCN